MNATLDLTVEWFGWSPKPNATPPEKAVNEPRPAEAGRRRRARVSQARQAELDEDRLLVDRARQGDQAAFARLMDRYQQRALAVAVGMMRSRDDAMDVVQDAFIKAHRNLDRFQGQSSFYTWLYRIIVNLCIDARRKRARSRTDALPDGVPEDAERASELEVSPVRPGTHPLQNAQNKQLGQHIQAALAKLTPNHRTILLLREVEGMSYEELASVLNISIGTVMSRLFHARHNMQKHLRPVLGLKDGQGLGTSRQESQPSAGPGPEQGGQAD
ncbi:MAG: sigma-70 family RNA polymerase sigma factor [Deltaproteobacteria bacterium]|nr:sigma-70 family RNA polymerase sigma factor [Deltaproteobacteria bacterium]